MICDTAAESELRQHQPTMKPPQESNTQRAAVAHQRLVRLSDAMIAWNPTWGLCARGGEPGQVGVCKHPEGGQLKHLSMWCKPSQSIPKGPYPQKEAKHAWTMLRLMVEVWHIACRDGVPLENIHAALAVIPEYNDMLSEDFKVILPAGPLEVDTPETDGFVQDHDFQPSPSQCLNFARRLERERDEAREKLKWRMHWVETLRRVGRKLRHERDEARKYADKLAAGLPDGMLPKDVEVLREANFGLAMELDETREQLTVERALADRLADTLKFIGTDNIANANDMRYRANKALTAWKEARSE